jgi:hypothetical protein
MTSRKTRTLRAIFAGAVLTLVCSTPALAQYGGSDKPTTKPATNTNRVTFDIPIFDFGSFENQPVLLPEIHSRTVTCVIFVEPFSWVQWYIESDPIFLGKFQADANGKVVATVTIPETLEAGNHTMVAKGTDKNGKPVEMRRPVVLAAAEAAPSNTPSSLSLTGSNARGIAAVGGVLLVVGGAATFATRRRLTDAD